MQVTGLASSRSGGGGVWVCECMVSVGELLDLAASTRVVLLSNIGCGARRSVRQAPERNVGHGGSCMQSLMGRLAATRGRAEFNGDLRRECGHREGMWTTSSVLHCWRARTLVKLAVSRETHTVQRQRPHERRERRMQNRTWNREYRCAETSTSENAECRTRTCRDGDRDM